MIYIFILMFFVYFMVCFGITIENAKVLATTGNYVKNELMELSTMTMVNLIAIGLIIVLIIGVFVTLCNGVSNYGVTIFDLLLIVVMISGFTFLNADLKGFPVVTGYKSEQVLEEKDDSSTNSAQKEQSNGVSESLTNDTQIIEDSEGNKYAIIYNEDENPTVIKIE